MDEQYTDYSDKLYELVGEYQRLHRLIVPQDKAELKILWEWNTEHCKIVWIIGKGRGRQTGPMYGWHGDVKAVCQIVADEIELQKSILRERKFDF